MTSKDFPAPLILAIKRWQPFLKLYVQSMFVLTLDYSLSLGPKEMLNLYPALASGVM